MEHYFSEKPKSPLSQITVPIEIDGKIYKFTTASGVFSYAKLDRGTQLLVEALELKKTDEFLDLGCGWGFIGIYASRNVKKVMLIDINERAVATAKKNVKQNNIKNCEVLKSDGFANLKGRTFDVIATNPPTHAGKELILDLVEDSYDHLKKGGRFYFVSKTKLGAKSYGDFIGEVFKNIKVVSLGSGYRVFLAIR